MNERSQEAWSNPNMLAKQAKMEIRQTGFTGITCPKCGTHPTITITPRGERTIVSCACRYVSSVDINF